MNTTATNAPDSKSEPAMSKEVIESLDFDIIIAQAILEKAEIFLNT